MIFISNAKELTSPTAPFIFLHGRLWNEYFAMGWH
jgi:hypothetical protein